MADKLTVGEAKKDSKLVKKIDKLPKPEQEKWLKTYVSAFNSKVKDGEKDSVAKEYAARTAWDKVPAKFLDKPAKGSVPKKKGLVAYKEAFLADTDELMKTSSAEEVASLPTDPIDGFLMWMEANHLVFAKEEEPIVKEFTPEEQEFLKTVTGYGVRKDKEGYIVCLHGPEGPEGNVIEIAVSDVKEDTLEEEMHEETEEIIEEGLK